MQIICQNFIILTIITSLFLVPNRVKAEIFGCKGIVTNYSPYNFDKIHHDIASIRIPKRFDARKKWDNCKSLNNIKYQGKCGGCWAFASASAIADRECIQKKGRIDYERMSEQHLLECCRSCYFKVEEDIGGCNKGSIMQAFRFYNKRGVVPYGCKPASKRVINGTPRKECRKECANNANEKFKGKLPRLYGSRVSVQERANDPDIRHIMAEIMTNGPVVGVMDIYKYMVDRVPKNGILTYDESMIEKDEQPLRHAIKIIGWDKIDDIRVWTIANSWGKDWCNNGFCYVQRRKFGIEKYEIIAGFPETFKTQSRSDPKNTTSGSNCLKITASIQVFVVMCIFSMSSFFSIILQ